MMIENTEKRANSKY